MKLTYTDIAILALYWTSLYFIIKSLSLKWRIRHIEQVRHRRRANGYKG